mmetsp:Transcript_4841/g.14646  ORF Transcript_4841/g.14646 Transcript_4841/m.14646 type:complete len:212 (-) Transcript_4841:3770-4405(-)|eukprot:scaffold275742_cov33-Tisochrysis_lutea.AAC.5
MTIVVKKTSEQEKDQHNLATKTRWWRIPTRSGMHHRMTQAESHNTGAMRRKAMKHQAKKCVPIPADESSARARMDCHMLHSDQDRRLCGLLSNIISSTNPTDCVSTHPRKMDATLPTVEKTSPRVNKSCCVRLSFHRCEIQSSPRKWEKVCDRRRAGAPRRASNPRSSQRWPSTPARATPLMRPLNARPFRSSGPGKPSTHFCPFATIPAA